MGATAIPTAEVLIHAELENLDQKETRRLVRFIDRIDATYMAILHKKAEQKAKS